MKNFTGFALFAVFTFVVIGVAKIPMRFVVKGLKPLLFIIVFTGIINIFMTPGTVAFQIPYTWITATWEGMRMAAFMIVRLTFLIMGTSLLTLTSSPITLTDGIEHLLSPFKKIGVPGARAGDDDDDCDSVYPDAFGGNGKDYEGADLARGRL